MLNTRYVLTILGIVLEPCLESIQGNQTKPTHVRVNRLTQCVQHKSKYMSSQNNRGIHSQEIPISNMVNRINFKGCPLGLPTWVQLLDESWWRVNAPLSHQTTELLYGAPCPGTGGRTCTPRTGFWSCRRIRPSLSVPRWSGTYEGVRALRR